MSKLMKTAALVAALALALPSYAARGTADFRMFVAIGDSYGAAQTLTGVEPSAGLGQLILRGLGSEVDQALALHPTFIAVWLGGNDFLGAVSAGNPALLTTPTAFAAQYKALLDKLVAGAPNA